MKSVGTVGQLAKKRLSVVFTAFYLSQRNLGHLFFQKNVEQAVKITVTLFITMSYTFHDGVEQGWNKSGTSVERAFQPVQKAGIDSTLYETLARATN